MDNESLKEKRERLEGHRSLYVDGLISALGTEDEAVFIEEIHKLTRDEFVAGVRRLNKRYHAFHVELNCVLLQRAVSLYKLQNGNPGETES